MNGREVETGLVEKRQKKWDAADAEPREEAAIHSGAKCADAEQAELEQRELEAFRVQPIANEQGKRKNKHAGDLAAAERMFAEHFEHIGQERNTGAEEDEADDVERMSLFFAVVGQMQIDHDQADEANGNIEKENDAPMEVTDDEAAGDGSEHGSHKRGDGNEAHDANQV